MSKLVTRFTAALVLVMGASAAHLGANPHDVTLAVTMTNDLTSNAIQVYDDHLAKAEQSCVLKNFISQRARPDHQ